MTAPYSVWDRVVAAVDLTPSSVRAAITAARLMPPSAVLTVCAVTPDGDHVTPSTETADSGALDHVLAEIQSNHGAELHLREGSPLARLGDEIRAQKATLLTLGAGRSATNGVRSSLGPVAMALLHDAPCAVLIAPGDDGDGESIVVGYDGSGGAGRALVAGRELATRLLRPLRVLVATGDPEGLRSDWRTDELERGLDVIEDPQPAVPALLDASRSAGLLVVGSRHLTGALTQASVSEHAAAGARCPILVIR